MSPTKIDEILASRKQAEKTASGQGRKRSKINSSPFFLGEGLHEEFLELQFRDGLRLCLNYGDLQWFHYIPDENCIDMEFGGFLITIKGRGLVPQLFNGLKQKRVAWIKEADSELQDNIANVTFIEEIIMVPPQGFSEEGNE